MAKTIDKIKADLIGEVMSFLELENYMAGHKFHPIETEKQDKANDDIIKFTNYSSEIWVEYDKDEDGSVLISLVKSITRLTNENTKTDPFHTFSDLEKVQNYFKENGMLHHWLVGWLMIAEGRRIGDTMSLKWSDFFKANGKYRKRLIQLKEEKTGKVVAPVINEIAKNALDEYIAMNKISIRKCYHEKIFDCCAAAFRKALKKAVDEVGLDYPISTHSYRKFYANTLYKLHPQDASNIKIIQFILGHSDEETTRLYIGEIDEQIDKYNRDYERYIEAMGNGEDVEISNSPIVSLRAEDFRKMLSKTWDMAQGGKDKFESINEIIGMVEELVV